MRPGQAILVSPGVYQLQALAARVTALLEDGQVVLVDAGARGSMGLISAGLRALGYTPDRVRLVVVSHYHPDHIGNLASLVRATSAPVAAHRLEAPVVAGEVPLPAPHRYRVVAGLTRPLLPVFHEGPTGVNHLLDDGDSLPGAPDVQVIHTPGHTPGSICLHLASRRLIIVGDALQHRFGRLLPPASSVTQDPAQAMESLKKLLALDFDTICFSHSSAMKTGGRQALLRLLQTTPP